MLVRVYPLSVAIDAEVRESIRENFRQRLTGYVVNQAVDPRERLSRGDVTDPDDHRYRCGPSRWVRLPTGRSVPRATGQGRL